MAFSPRSSDLVVAGSGERVGEERVQMISELVELAIEIVGGRAGLCAAHRSNLTSTTSKSPLDSLSVLSVKTMIGTGG